MPLCTQRKDTSRSSSIPRLLLSRMLHSMSSCIRMRMIGKVIQDVMFLIARFRWRKQVAYWSFTFKKYSIEGQESHQMKSTALHPHLRIYWTIKNLSHKPIKTIVPQMTWSTFLMCDNAADCIIRSGSHNFELSCKGLRPIARSKGVCSCSALAASYLALYDLNSHSQPLQATLSHCCRGQSCGTALPA